LCNLYGYQDNEDEGVVMLSYWTSGQFFITFYTGGLCWFALSVLYYLAESIKLAFTIQYRCILRTSFCLFGVHFIEESLCIKDEIPTSVVYSISLALSVYVSTFHFFSWTYHEMTLEHSIFMKYNVTELRNLMFLIISIHLRTRNLTIGRAL
jgi:hypothetical protein